MTVLQITTLAGLAVTMVFAVATAVTLHRQNREFEKRELTAFVRAAEEARAEREARSRHQDADAASAAQASPGLRSREALAPRRGQE